MNITTERKTTTLLFNPFVYIAGGQALGLGLAAIFVASLIGFFSHTHFDGVLDTHTGSSAPLWFFLVEGVIDWLSLAIVLFALGKLISVTSFRAIDLFGTQALARWPTLLIVLLTLAPGYQRFTHEFIRQLTTKGQLQFGGPDAVVFFTVAFLMFPLLVWLITLMYRAYSLSCNVRGAKAVMTFIFGLILAEILSKIAIAEMAQVLR